MTAASSDPRGSAEPAWPESDGTNEQALEAFKSALGEASNMRAEFRAALRPDAANDQPFFDAYYETLKQRMGQSRAAAEIVQRAAAAIGAIYGAILGVAFSVQEQPLPLRGIIPAVFLGIAIVCSTVHLAWQGGKKGQLIPTTHPEREVDAFERRRAFIIDFQAIVGDFIWRRLGWLRSSIVALGIGLMMIPAPFINVVTTDSTSTTRIQAVEPAWSVALEELPTSGRDELDVVLFEAQVEEVASMRAQALAERPDADDARALRLSWLPDWGWLAATLVLLLLVGAAGTRWDGMKDRLLARVPGPWQKDPEPMNEDDDSDESAAAERTEAEPSGRPTQPT